MGRTGPVDGEARRRLLGRLQVAILIVYAVLLVAVVLWLRTSMGVIPGLVMPLATLAGAVVVVTIALSGATTLLVSGLLGLTRAPLWLVVTASLAAGPATAAVVALVIRGVT